MPSSTRKTLDVVMRHVEEANIASNRMFQRGC